MISIMAHNYFLDIAKKILIKLEKPYSGSSLARIAVEVGEEEDIRLLVTYGWSVDWNETAEDEDPAIRWALNNGKLKIVDVLMSVNKINLQGDPSADLTIHCDSESFRDHKYFLSARSQVFNTMLNSGLREERSSEIIIHDMNISAPRSLIHYVYTIELAEGWEELDIQDMAGIADKYDLAGWMELFCPALEEEEEEVSDENVVAMILFRSRYQHGAAKELRVVARKKRV